MTRYHGFTCPNCGSHFFGTHTHHAVMGDAYPAGTRIGTCHGSQYGQDPDCKFTWNRDDKQAESQAMYEQTEEEWMTSAGEFLKEFPSKVVEMTKYIEETKSE